MHPPNWVGLKNSKIPTSETAEEEKSSNAKAQNADTKATIKEGFNIIGKSQDVHPPNWVQKSAPTGNGGEGQEKDSKPKEPTPEELKKKGYTIISNAPHGNAHNGQDIHAPNWVGLKN